MNDTVGKISRGVPGETGHLSSGIWNLGVFSQRCTGESLPLRFDFIHRVEFHEVSGHRVLIKRGPDDPIYMKCPDWVNHGQKSSSGFKRMVDGAIGSDC